MILPLLLLLLLLLAASSALATPSTATLDKWFQAALQGDTKTVMQLYSENSNLLNQIDGDTGRTALLIAAINDHTKLAEALAQLPDLDVNVYEKSGSKSSALDAAVQGGNFAIFQLLAHRVDLNEENDSTGQRPIHAACAGMNKGHHTILQSLLENYPVSAWDESRDGTNCMGFIMRAMRPTQFRPANQLKPEAYAFKREMVRLVLMHGASTAGLSDDEIALLQLTHREVRAAQSRESQNDDASAVTRDQQNIPVLRGAKWKSSDVRLLEAIQRSHAKWAEIEVKLHGANVNVLHPTNKQTPFMTTALKGNVRMLGVLLDLGADPSRGEEKGYTAFHGAAFQGHAEVVRFLCDNLDRVKLDPNEMHRDGYRPIHRACWGKDARFGDFVRTLVQHCGVDPDTPTKQGQTPLQVLVSHEQYFNVYTARALAESGANVQGKLKETDQIKLRLVSDDDFTTCRAEYTNQ